MSDNIQDYAEKITKETKKIKKIYLITIILSVIISFSFGVYYSYVSLENNAIRNEQINKFNTIYQTILEEWYYGVGEDNLDEIMITNAIEGMLAKDGDIFTRYVTSIDYLQEQAVGIGISVMEYREYFYISDVVSQGAIDNDIRIGDILKKIDGVDLAYKSIAYISSLLKDKNNVSLLIERNNEEILKMAPINLYETVSVVADHDLNDDSLYVRIKEFGTKTAADLKKEFQLNSKRKLVLDLRDNPGGYISSVVEVADLFLPINKVVLETKNKKGESIKYKTKDNNKFDFDKIIILINNKSASGAEALSAALNEQLGETVVLMGETTYGKGSAQKTMSLGDNTYLAYTYALWFTPNGNSIQHVGVSAEEEYEHVDLFTYDFVGINLEKDDLGDDVKNLQLILTKMGYHGENWEYFGYYSTEVETAIKAFQNDEGIDQTGKLDEITLRHLISCIKDSQVSSYDIELNYAFDNIDIIGNNDGE